MKSQYTTLKALFQNLQHYIGHLQKIAKDKTEVEFVLIFCIVEKCTVYLPLTSCSNRRKALNKILNSKN